MKYDDIEKKWKTDETRVVTSKICNAVPPNNEIDVLRNVHSAPMGDLIKEYVKHINIPWYKKLYDWSIVENRLRTVLNSVTLEWTD